MAAQCWRQSQRRRLRVWSTRLTPPCTCPPSRQWMCCSTLQVWAWPHAHGVKLTHLLYPSDSKHVKIHHTYSSDNKHAKIHHTYPSDSKHAKIHHTYPSDNKHAKIHHTYSILAITNMLKYITRILARTNMLKYWSPWLLQRFNSCIAWPLKYSNPTVVQSLQRLFTTATDLASLARYLESLSYICLSGLFVFSWVVICLRASEWC